MATARAFSSMPDEVWRWYLHRRGICRAAAPNAAHDGAGPPGRTLRRPIPAGHAERRRAAPARRRRSGPHLPDPRQHRFLSLRPGLRAGPSARSPTEPTPAALRCACGDRLRPHVLWFDESYDEPLYRYVSALRAAQSAAALIVVGTSGATTLPTRMCEMVAARGAPLIVARRRGDARSPSLARTTPARPVPARHRRPDGARAWPISSARPAEPARVAGRPTRSRPPRPRRPARARNGARPARS